MTPQPTTAGQPPTAPPGAPGAPLPNHLQLPETDGAIVESHQEHPQGNLLTSSFLPRLREIHPDGQFPIGHDSGIYFRYTSPPLEGCRSPDWYYVPGVPPMLDGTYRRSYVLWHVKIPPLLLIELASGDGSEERDRTPDRGKFWIYENAIRAGYYGIFVCGVGALELYRHDGVRYVPVRPNAAGRLPVDPLGVELGVWHGSYRFMELPWVRFWDSGTGRMLLAEEERADEESARADEEHRRAEEERARAEQEHRRAEGERQRAEAEGRRAEEEHRRAEQERARAERLAARLRELGVDPDA